MKPAWQEDIEADEQDPYVDAIQTGLLVIALTAVCVVVLFFLLGLIWPHVEGWM
jgi:hypothetical protein